MNQMMNTLYRIRQNPGNVAIIHDFDGVIGNDGGAEFFDTLKSMHDAKYGCLSFWDDFLEPWYLARERGRFVRLNNEYKRAEMTERNGDGARFPYIGDEMIFLQQALIAGLPTDKALKAIEEFYPKLELNPSAIEQTKWMRELYANGLVIASGSFKELIYPALEEIKYPQDDVFITSLVGKGTNSVINPIYEMIASGRGKIDVMEDIMNEREKDYAVVIDDGTTGINVAIEASEMDNAITICPNPNIPMLRNVPETIVLSSHDLCDIPRILSGELNPVPLSDWETSPDDSKPKAVYISPDDDIGVPRTENHVMPWGFVGYCQAEESSFADYVQGQKKNIKMVRLGNL